MRCSFCGAETLDHERAVELELWRVRTLKGGARTFGSRPTGRIACRRCAHDIANGLEPNTPKLL